jgi:hypothetical protein
VSNTAALLDGLAQQLAAAGIGVYADSYTDGQIGITFGEVPQHPSQLLVLTPYQPRADGAFMSDSSQNVQVRHRGDENITTLWNRSDRIFALWQDQRAVVIGGVFVVRMGRINRTPNGRDDNRRWEMFENWQVDLVWPDRTDD